MWVTALTAALMHQSNLRYTDQDAIAIEATRPMVGPWKSICGHRVRVIVTQVCPT